MKKILPQFFSALFVLLLLSSGCTAARSEGVAIYLTKADIPPAHLKALSHIDTSDQPIISSGDIVTYNAQTHELKLTASAFERISKMDVPVQGRSFAVCVDKKPIYCGAFWTPVSSISFDGVTIWKPYGSTGIPVITLEMGYPSSSFYQGEDPRNNPEILKSLEQAGKLINRLSLTAVNILPHSFKGYELYSWSEGDDWRFTLITGTNRNKTLDEIITQEDFISEAGWVKVSVAGMDNIKAVLRKLPKNESVLWLAGMRDSSGQTAVKIELPPQQTRDSIKDFAEQCGLDFHIQTS